MKKNKLKNEPMVCADVEGRKSEKGHLSSVGRYATESNEARKPEKIWFVQLGQVRRHSRILYLPLDSSIVNMYRIKKGDRIKYMMLQLIRAPAEDEPLREVDSGKGEVDPGEL